VVLIVDTSASMDGRGRDRASWQVAARRVIYRFLRATVMVVAADDSAHVLVSARTTAAASRLLMGSSPPRSPAT
jgi:hypothetical protein